MPKERKTAEVKIIVPIPKDAKHRLEERADENGRAMCREASKIIVEAVRK